VLYKFRRRPDRLKIAVLSSAPSIIEEWEARKGEGWDLTVGISTTCWFIDCDWMAWMDGWAIRGMIERRRTPLIGSLWHALDFRWAPYIDNAAYPLFDGGEKSPFTLPNALNWVLLKWPDAEIEIMGMTLKNGPNVGGNSDMNEVQAVEELKWVKRAFSEALERCLESDRALSARSSTLQAVL